MRDLKIYLLILLVMSVFIACDTTETTPEPQTSIPPDPSGITVPTPTKNNALPTATFTLNGTRMKINLQGLLDPSTNQPIQFNYNTSNPQGSNIFVEENGVVKGLLVNKVGSGNVLTADVVFTVDNSGSMDQEADSIAKSIIEFANFLQSSGLDVKFAVVGYFGNVNGAINFSSAAAIENYLNRPSISGTNRTVGFSGPDSAALDNKANSFAPGVYGENGVVGVLFADSNFTWRSGAQRVIINFTDESTQPDNNLFWNTARMCNLMSGRATIHTVYSGPADTSMHSGGSWGLYDERPWEMSICSGGSVKFIPQNATGLDLKNLPVAGTLTNSYLVEYNSAASGTLTVKITIFTPTADGSKTFTITN